MKIRHTWENVDQPDDEQGAGSPWFYVSSYKEFHKGLILAQQELEKYSTLVNELELKASPYEKELKRIKRMIEWGEEHLKGKRQDDDIYINGVTYGSLRYLKAGALLRAQNIIEKRNEVLHKNRFIPQSIVQTYDERIGQLLNLAEQGVFNGLRPANVFFEVSKQAGETNVNEEITLVSSITGDQYNLTEIPIIDSILRERCLGLLRAVLEEGSENRLDTIIREMSVILEDRVRDISGYTGKLTGVELFSALMAKEPFRIKFSDQKDLQESAHLLFRGYSGFVRNEVMHKLVPSYTKERVLQLLGTVDYLLFVLSRAQVNKIDG
jgi:hypothetical protein